MCVCVRYVGQEPVLFSGTVSDNIARGRSGKSQPLYVLTSTYQYVTAFERKEGRKIERHRCVFGCIRFMTNPCTNNPRCAWALLTIFCLVLSRLVLSVNHSLRVYFCYHCCSFYFILFIASYTSTSSSLTSSSPLYHGPTELGVVLPSLQEVMASESNSTFSACMPKSKPVPAPSPASAPTASGFKDSVGTVTDMEGGLFGTGN